MLWGIASKSQVRFEDGHGRFEVGGGKVGVSEGHFEVALSQQVKERCKIDTCHDEARGECVLHFMKPSTITIELSVRESYT